MDEFKVFQAMKKAKFYQPNNFVHLVKAFTLEAFKILSYFCIMQLTVLLKK